MRLNLFIPQSKHNAQLGVGRRLLRVLGPSWASAPVRRGIQTLSLAAFLALLLYVSMPAGGARTADELAARERVEAESFLRLDPLVAVAAAVAGRSWVPALIWVAVLLGVCLVLPRMFCGYVCPMGTMIDLFDWAIGGRLKFLHLRRRGWWVHLRFVLLGAVLLAAACGWLVAGYVAAIPVVTRGLAFAIGPLRSAMAGTPRPGTWSLEHGLGVGVLAAVLVLGVLGGRFWCRCVCPSGAMLSVWSLLRLTGRHVTSACVSCGNCRKACSFDAIKDDYSTRATACTFCQDCGGVAGRAGGGALRGGGRSRRGDPAALARARCEGDSPTGGAGRGPVPGHMRPLRPVHPRLPHGPAGAGGPERGADRTVDTTRADRAGCVRSDL